ncbi:uncharacterized protein MELLADRAFT_63192 [Melampsora larici-populina 98AG31]|uniref:Uncharacterized protein n=1 Tax=Melampsora larici-populina (strain 98AG31 / pathotype 3-4-7) TaxID=747676 RepID=F4RLR9_MELLP|nr:uncharacterized protein MELLADRAFT_63192 [Melampsora larici-populina 98AG31]EGG06585.1 hypothetical protein MELLADRAFT_63192 [Melampsora larici-populina 98AG31]
MLESNKSDKRPGQDLETCNHNQADSTTGPSQVNHEQVQELQELKRELDLLKLVLKSAYSHLPIVMTEVAIFRTFLAMREVEKLESNFGDLEVDIISLQEDFDSNRSLMRAHNRAIRKLLGPETDCLDKSYESPSEDETIQGSSSLSDDTNVLSQEMD